MRGANVGGFTGILIAVATFAVCSGAQAQSGTVKAVFEKYGLLGTFSADCSKPPAKDNVYYVNRLLDPDHVQRDLMDGPTNRAWFAVLDQARETGPNQIWLGGTRDGQPTDGIWCVEARRVLQWEATLGGRQVIAGGRLLSTGREMPWFSKCAAQ